MKDQNKKVALLLKGMIVVFAFVGIWVYFNLVPSLLEASIIEDVTGMMANIEMTNEYKEYLINSYYLLIALYACTGIPCYVVLFLVWKMADTVEKGKAFIHENAKRLKWIGKLALFDAVVGIVVVMIDSFMLEMYSELFYLMVMACFFALPFALVTWALSYMVEKASELQIESDYTI